MGVVLLSCAAFVQWAQDSAEWLIYSNPNVGIDFKYPNDAILRSVNEGGLPVEIDENSRVIEVVDGRTGEGWSRSAASRARPKRR